MEFYKPKQHRPGKSLRAPRLRGHGGWKGGKASCVAVYPPSCWSRSRDGIIWHSSPRTGTICLNIHNWGHLDDQPRLKILKRGLQQRPRTVGPPSPRPCRKTTRATLFLLNPRSDWLIGATCHQKSILLSLYIMFVSSWIGRAVV